MDLQVQLNPPVRLDEANLSQLEVKSCYNNLHNIRDCYEYSETALWQY